MTAVTAQFTLPPSRPCFGTPVTHKGAAATFRIGLTTCHPSRDDEFVRSAVRPSAAFRLARWTALTPPASVPHARGDIPAAPAGRGAADGRTYLLNELR